MNLKLDWPPARRAVVIPLSVSMGSQMHIRSYGAFYIVVRIQTQVLIHAHRALLFTELQGRNLKTNKAVSLTSHI